MWLLLPGSARSASSEAEVVVAEAAEVAGAEETAAESGTRPGGPTARREEEAAGTSAAEVAEVNIFAFIQIFLVELCLSAVKCKLVPKIFRLEPIFKAKAIFSPRYVQEEEDGEIEAETVAALCPPTTGGRRSLGMAATAEAEAATEATEEAAGAGAAERGAGTGAGAGTATPRTGPSPPPGTSGWRRSCSTRAMAPPASTLIGQ